MIDCLSKLIGIFEGLDLSTNRADGDGLLSDALNDKDKVTKASVTARLKLATDPKEVAALKQAKKLFDAEAKAKKALSEKVAGHLKAMGLEWTL